MPSRRIPIALRIVLVYLAVAALFNAGFIHRLVTSQRDQLVAEVAKKGDAVTRLFARGLTTPLFNLDVHLMQSQISHVKALQDVGEVLVFNDRGQCVTDGTPENPRLGDVIAEAQPVLASPARKPHRHASPERLLYASTVILGDRTLGGVQLEFSLDTVAAQVKALRDWLTTIAVVLSLLGAIPVFLIAQYFLKPLLFGDE